MSSAPPSEMIRIILGWPDFRQETVCGYKNTVTHNDPPMVSKLLSTLIIYYNDLCHRIWTLNFLQIRKHRAQFPVPDASIFYDMTLLPAKQSFAAPASAAPRHPGVLSILE